MRISGYEKTLRSRTESFYVENLDTLDTLTRITASIDYLDMKQRQLHRRTVSVECNIPPGQRRLLTFPTWDRQFVMYYHLSAPARSSAQATAYDVKISPLAAEVSPAYSTSPNR